MGLPRVTLSEDAGGKARMTKQTQLKTEFSVEEREALLRMLRDFGESKILKEFLSLGIQQNHLI